MSKRVVLYARISIAADESVSVARQLTSGRSYAKARGWTVVGEFIDDGVSATRNKPQNRAGWSSLLATSEWFDAVIIWKVDRLARRVADFLHADETLQTRGAAIVCVEQSIDMTTSEGRAFAQMLAVFGEMEAGAISSRMKAARDHLIRNGRVPGGAAPYGWCSVPNPAGPGRVLAQDPDRIHWVRGMVERAQQGDNVHSICRWLDGEGAPPPRGAQQLRATPRWVYSTVHRLLGNPLLAGMVLHNPGNGQRGTLRDVLRDTDGNPVIRHDLAIITIDQHHHLLRLLADKAHVASMRRDLRNTTSPILSLLGWCGVCHDRDYPMVRGVTSGRDILKCPRCFQVISVRLLARYLEIRLVAERGEVPMQRLTRQIAVDKSAALKLERLETQLRATALTLLDDTTDHATAQQHITVLRNRRAVLHRKTGAQPRDVLLPVGLTVAEAWSRCRTDEQRRDIFAGQIGRLTIYRGNRGGRALDESRINLTWKDNPKSLLPDDISPALLTAGLPERDPWISVRMAAALAGCSEHDIRRAVTAGTITRRHLNHSHASLSTPSVIAFRETRRWVAADT